MTVSVDQPQIHEVPPATHRFTSDEYLRLSTDGFFQRSKVEFIDGEIIDVAAQLNDHVFCLGQTFDAFV